MQNDLRPVALLLTPVWPAPGESGRALRAWDWLQELSQSHRVIVLVDGQDKPPQVPHADIVAKTWSVPREDASSSRWRQALALLCPPLCLIDHGLIIDWTSWRLGQVLQALETQLAGQPVDRVIVFRLYLHDAAAQIARHFPEARIELDMDDLESRTRASVSLALLRMGRYRQALVACGLAAQYALIERFSRGLYQKVWLASKEDGQRLRTLLAPKVGHRPNRLPPVPVLPDPPREILRLLFVGTLNYPPNEEAVRMLLLKVLPILRTMLSMPWRLCVVGRHASASLQALLAACPEVEFVPDAAQVQPWYEVSQIVLVPLRAGGGTKFKSLEGFAHRRAVVSTKHGMRGLNAVPGEHYLLARTPAQFAQAILRLASDEALSPRLAEAGRSLVTMTLASE